MVNKLTGKRLTFHAIHSTGLYTLVIDIDTKQIEGIS